MKGTPRRRVLVAGWFSFELPHCTAGDLLAQRTAVRWATSAGFSCSIAVPHPAASNEVPTAALEPSDYDVVVFVCGPLTSSHVKPFMRQFPCAKRIALNVTIL